MKLPNNDRIALQARVATRHDANGLRLKIYDGLVRDFAKLNGVRPTHSFTPEELWEQRFHVRRQFTIPTAFDHDVYFSHGRRPALILVEPYHGQWEDTVRAALGAGLVVHTPPNPQASFWLPPHTRSVVITHRDFGPVRWLADQLEYFEIEPPVLPTVAPTVAEGSRQ